MFYIYTMYVKYVLYLWQISKPMLRIKEVIKEKGLTLTEVAEKLGVKQPAISSIINGNPTVEVLNRLSSAIGCDVSDFFDKRSVTVNCPYCGKDIEVSLSKKE